MSAQHDLNTSVADVAIVAHGSGQGRRCITRGAHVRRQLQVHQHVLRLLAIPVNNQVNAVVQEAQVETDVELLLLLPLHTLVGKVLGLVARAQRRVDHRDGGAPKVTTDIGVTSLTPTQTQLTVGEPIHVLHELLVGKAPRTGERVETCPAVRGTEVGATVIAVGVGRIVTVIVAVGPTGEERSHRRAAKAVVDLGRALTQLGIVNIVRRQVGVGYTRVVPFRLPALLTKHGGQVVKVGNGLGVGQVVLQLPEGARVLLNRASVGGTVPGTQVNGGFPLFTLRRRDVVTKFGVPNDVFQEIGVNLKEDVTGQFLTVQQDLVQQCQSNRVGVGVTFLRDAAVAAVDIIDRNRGNGGQRVVDDTLVTVGELQVIVGIRERGVQT